MRSSRKISYSRYGIGLRAAPVTTLVARLFTVVAFTIVANFAGANPAAAQAVETTTQASSQPSPFAAETPSSQTTAPAVPTSALKPSAEPSHSARRAQTVSPTEPATVISYLSDMIGWYRHLGVESQLVGEPNETLFFADSRQTANEILDLAFEYARAQADFIARHIGETHGAGGESDAASHGAVQQPRLAGLSDLGQKNAAADAEVAALQSRIKDLQIQLGKASPRNRTSINTAIGAARSELDLAEARADAIRAIVQFEGGTRLPEQKGGLASQIDELERSIPDSERNLKHPIAAVTAPGSGAGAQASNGAQPTVAAAAVGAEAQPEQPSGILGLASDLIALQHKSDTLEQTIEITKALAARVTSVRSPLLKLLGDIDDQGVHLAQENGTADVATLRTRKQAFEKLLDEHKLAAAAALPLSKQLILFEVYINNVARWNAAVDQRTKGELRSLAIRLILLLATFGLIFLGALAWRKFTDRYVKDIRRRGQVMAARRLVLGLLVTLVLLVNFSSELGSAATILGFAAAGIAVALQNVILSIAGYFFLIGRFGIKAGDRVQIGGVTGDVIDIGLVKLSLLELGGSGSHRQPTGRVVVFSNAIVFQPSGNFFKQVPGTSFIWNEVRLTLAPDCDYRLAEKRLLDAVDEVFARYRDRVLSDYRRLERDLNMLLESPKPQSRLSLSQNGLEVIIRYPTEMHTAPQISDEVSRRVLDAINREPNLRLAMQGIANIQAQTPPPVSTETDGVSAEK